MRTATLFLLVSLAVLIPARDASASSCNVSGYMRVESQDPYYCDTDYLNCQNWNEVDLDVKRGLTASPLAYMPVQIKKTDGTLLKTTYTNTNGYYSAWFNLSGSCSGQTVQVVNWFKRVHEDDTGVESNPRYRFRVSNSIGQS